MADCCCSALFQSLTYNDKNHLDYIYEIKEKFFCNKNKKILSYGLKLVPNGINSKELNNLIKYLNKK